MYNPLSSTEHEPRLQWKQSLWAYGVHVVTPLVLGSLIYVLFRHESLLVFDWLERLGVDDHAQALRACCSQWKLPDWVAYSVPDGLWCWAATAWLWMIWKRINCWTLTPLALAWGSEIGQLAHLVPGTFDLADLFSYSLGGLAAPILLNHKIRKGTVRNENS